MIHTCRICGKTFEDNIHNTAVCNNCRTAVCVVCGKSFRREYPFTQETCSTKCGGILRKQRGSNKGSKTVICNIERICCICGDSFIAKSSRRQICYRKHYHRCPVCGKDVLTTSIHDIDKCCSKECSRIKASKTYQSTISKLGYSPCNSESANEKRRQTNIQRYGVDNIFKSKQFIESIPDRLFQKYGTTNINDIPGVKDKKHTTCMQKYGVEHPCQSDVVKQKIKQTVKSRYGDSVYFRTSDYKHKSTNTNLQKYGVAIPMQNRDVHLRQTHAKSSYIASDGTKLDSSYELIVYEFCLRNNLSVKINVPIQYEYKGKSHVTYIDFEIEGQLFECKGYHLLQGIYDNVEGVVPISEKLLLYRKHHVILITSTDSKSLFGRPNSKESNGLRYPDKCPNPLIGVDIELFKDTPDFPYKDNKPKCFYNVKVDGQLSSYEAFYNEHIRWKMILNRIQYSGGFIDGNQILTALNVTRTCKQPSWFSEALATNIIKNYCTSDIIVDCFAGWGSREKATVKLHRKYIGIDFNPDLVEWHHSCGRTDIQYGDAKKFRYDGECSVFICPPYSDLKTGRCFEDYNFEGFTDEAKGLSQCDWLKIVMQNVPNAKEYVMVCKIVDPGFEQYIVDTKINKSHFGKNSEYILVVPNLMDR